MKGPHCDAVPSSFFTPTVSLRNRTIQQSASHVSSMAESTARYLHQSHRRLVYMLAGQTEILTVYEANRIAVNPAPVAHRFTTSLEELV